MVARKSHAKGKQRKNLQKRKLKTGVRASGKKTCPEHIPFPY